MIIKNPRSARAFIAATTALTLFSPIVAGCGRGSSNSNETSAGNPPNYGTVPPPPGAKVNKGLSRGQEVAILAGTAALMYLYNKHKNSQGTGPNGQYYQSKNGRIYYRDAKGNAVYVTPPAGGIQVPADVAAQYSQYNNGSAAATGM